MLLAERRSELGRARGKPGITLEAPVPFQSAFVEEAQSPDEKPKHHFCASGLNTVFTVATSHMVIQSSKKLIFSVHDSFRRKTV